jgi:hypothetical protein
MKKTASFLLLIAVVVLLAVPMMAQPKPRVSPPDVTSAVIDGNRVMLVYSRPFSKSPKSGEVRKIWGGLVPYGKVWRTGANEATLLILQQPIAVGDVVIPAGAHSLFTLPAEDGSAKLIVNNQIGQWGLQYDEKQDLARIDLKKDNLETAVDQFTMAVEKNPAGGGVLKMMWENTQYSLAFTVKK